MFRLRLALNLFTTESTSVLQKMIFHVLFRTKLKGKNTVGKSREKTIDLQRAAINSVNWKKKIPSCGIKFSFGWSTSLQDGAQVRKKDVASPRQQLNVFDDQLQEPLKEDQSLQEK